MNDIYRDYFQKSRIFIFPALEIKKGSSVVPYETYSMWKGHYSLEDCKLCVHYLMRDDFEFKTFERNKLLGNRLFHDFKRVEENDGVYVFDISEYVEDWNNFTKGKYSKLSEDMKKKIKAFYGTRDPNYAYIESYLYPEKYFRMYAEMMSVKEDILREVGELCSKPDFDNELLDIKIKDLDITNKTS